MVNILVHKIFQNTASYQQTRRIIFPFTQPKFGDESKLLYRLTVRIQSKN